MTKLNDLLVKTAVLNLPGLGTAAALTGIQMNQEINIFEGDTVDAARTWDQSHRRNARAKLNELAKNHPIDVETALEATRLIFLERSRYMYNPLSIFFEIIHDKQYHERLEDEGIDDNVIQQAYYQMMNVLFDNQKAFENALLAAPATKSVSALALMLTDKIYNVFLRELGNVPIDVLNKYLKIIRAIIYDVVFMARTVSDFKLITDYRNAPLFELMIMTTSGDGMNRTGNGFGRCVRGQVNVSNQLINLFYGRDIMELSDKEPDNIHKLDPSDCNLEEIEEYPDTESFDQESLDLFELQLSNEMAYNDRLSDQLKASLEEGICRADVIVLEGRDPIKDREYLSQFTVQRSKTNIHEAQMGLIKSVKKGTQKIIRGIMKLIESIINSTLKLMLAPFDIEASFTVTDATQAVKDWGKTFNSSLHDYIEERGEEVKNPEKFKSVIEQLSAAGTQLGNHVTMMNRDVRISRKEKDVERLKEQKRATAQEIIDTMTSVTAAISDTAILTDWKKIEHTDLYSLDETGGLTIKRIKELPVIERAKDLKRKLVKMGNSKVKARQGISEDDIFRLYDELPDLFEISTVQERVQTIIASTRTVTREINRDPLSFDKTDSINRDRDYELYVIVSEYGRMYNEAYRLLLAIFKLMNLYADIFRVLFKEVTAIKATAREIKHL